MIRARLIRARKTTTRCVGVRSNGNLPACARRNSQPEYDRDERVCASAEERVEANDAGMRGERDGERQGKRKGYEEEGHGDRETKGQGED